MKNAGKNPVRFNFFCSSARIIFRHPVSDYPPQSAPGRYLPGCRWEVLCFVQNSLAVSYTHLDVYKRQVIAVGELQSSCIQIIIKAWCDCDDYWPLYYEMQESVKLLFDAHHISIPYPQTDVHLKTEKPISIVSEKERT